MKKRFPNLLLLFFLFTATTIQAQISCNYTLQLFDSFGDGWNGSNLAVTVNGITTNYTLNDVTDDGSFNQFLIAITDGDSISLNYSSGAFEGEVSYFLFDSENLLVFADGNNGINPQIGDIFGTTGSCPSCPVPATADIFLDDIRAFYADISWVPTDSNGDYVIEFGLDGFSLGMGQVMNATGFETRLEPLQENTTYDFYMTVLCENGDTSNIVGPVSFQTLWANDVGIVGFSTPESGCGLGTENIMISMQNFGGLPQALIPFNFSVNDVDGGVPMPQDGFFTGVIGKDSIVDIEFETTFDFSEPGEYIVKVWTDLEADSFRINDTLEFVVLSVPEVDELPYFQNFEEWNGGWTIGEDSQNTSWDYGSPAGALISEAASGFFAWVSNLSGDYNNNELSYLESPCFDFSDLTEDPRLTFSLFFESELCCDELWVERSIDGGETWTKVGASGTGANWYNDAGNQWWDGTGNFDGWVKAFNTLEGVAGEAEVRVRFVLSTDGSVTREGVGIDDILIAVPSENDLAGASVGNGGNVDCGTSDDIVQLSILNAGLEAQTGFDVAYSINGGTPVIENVGTLIIQPEQEVVYAFQTTFSSLIPGPIEIRAWIATSDDLSLNDTTTFVLNPMLLSLPVSEDFESGVFPMEWTSDEINPISPPNDHNNDSWVISDNNYLSDPLFSLESAAYGPLEATSVLSFEYRYTEWAEGTEPTVTTPEDILRVEVSKNCGFSFDTIWLQTGDQHLPTTDFTQIELSLADYLGESIIIRFTNTWGASDYWFDMDNININACAVFAIDAEIVGETTVGSADGSITLTPQGGEEYTYAWSTGDTGATITNLVAGEYSVTVTDEQGCTNVFNYTIDVLTGIEEISSLSYLNLYPNPTNSISTLDLRFNEAVDVDIQVFNVLGQVVISWQNEKIIEKQYQLPLSDKSGGVYLVKILANGESHTLKLIKGN